MFQLVKFGILPNKFLAFQDYQCLCASCLFGKAHRKGWRKKLYVRHGIRQDDDNKTGASTSTDQLVSAQAGIVYQTSIILTGSRIWGANVMVNHFSNFISVRLMSSISVEQTLAAKKSSERLTESYVVKAKRYHVDNGRYVEQICLDAVEDANQDIIFCAIGAHHQNGISESHI